MRSKIARLREAKAQLGPKFDTTFRDEILNDGAMPLSPLHERVER